MAGSVFGFGPRGILPEQEAQNPAARRSTIDRLATDTQVPANVLMALEDYGFCGPGESGEFVASGAIRPDGRLPINTAGGLLSEAYVHGMNLLTEGVRQLRGTSTTQITNASTCLVTGGLGVSPTSGAILGRY